jgi:hypothetical protein
MLSILEPVAFEYCLLDNHALCWYFGVLGIQGRRLVVELWAGCLPKGMKVTR